jgi:hypothetical protein
VTALLLAAVLAAPIHPVGYVWEISPEPPPPAIAPPDWTPFRLDILRVSLRATEDSTVKAGLYYRIDEHPEHGWVPWRVPVTVWFGAGQTLEIAFEIPWDGYAPGPALLAVWQQCGDGRVHNQGAAIPRPGQMLPPEWAGMPFHALDAGAFCPETASIFADGFETGDLSRWGGAS